MMSSDTSSGTPENLEFEVGNRRIPTNFLLLLTDKGICLGAGPRISILVAMTSISPVFNFCNVIKKIGN